MSQVLGRGNLVTEIRLVELMRKHKITGWRRGSKLIGKPDFVFAKAKLIVFVDGCFWHGCPKHMRMPKSGVEYWQKKISRNKKRDRKVTKELQTLGWRVLRIWEHSLRKKLVNRTILRLQRVLAAVPQTELDMSPPAAKISNTALISKRAAFKNFDSKPTKDTTTQDMKPG